MKSLRGRGYFDAALGHTMDYTSEEHPYYLRGYYDGTQVLSDYRRNRKAIVCLLSTVIVCSGFAAIYTGSKPMCIYSMVISVTFPWLIPAYGRYHRKRVIAVANRLR